MQLAKGRLARVLPLILASVHISVVSAQTVTVTVQSDSSAQAAPIPVNDPRLFSGNTQGLSFQAVDVGAFGTFTPVPPGAPANAVVVNIPPDDGESGFFKTIFTLPSAFTGIQLSGSANVDDDGFAFLNGNLISSQLTEFGNVAFSTTNPQFFKPGLNELVISDNNNGFGPSGAAFFASISYTPTNTGLIMHAGFGGGPTAPGTETKSVDQAAVSASIPLGSQFFIQLAKAGSTGSAVPVPADFVLGTASISPAITGATLFPNSVVLEFDANSANDTKDFRAVHLGAVTLTITPSDPSLNPVTVNITVIQPASLGSTHNDIDAALFDFGNRRGIPPHFLKGQIQRESDFDPQSYRYEPLSVDMRSISAGANLRTQSPYSLYRMATSDGLAQGANILPDDISPRSIYDIARGGVTRTIVDTDQFVSAADVYNENDGTQNWSSNSPARARRVAANPTLLDFTAQTPIAASYGFLQILYTTAIAPMRWRGINGSRNPSFLFDTDAHLSAGGGSLDAGSGYLRRIFGRANPTINLPSPAFTAPTDFTAAFRRAFNMYNHKSTTGGYGAAVIGNAASFSPVPATSIF